MMKRIVMLLTMLGSLLVMSSPGLVYAQAAPTTPAPTTSSSDAKSAVCDGLSQVNGGGANSCDTTPGSDSVGKIIRAAISIFSFVIGVAAVVMIIIGGFKYVTSGGDSGKVASAKDTILFAIIGLVVAALAQVMVQFVLNRIPK